MKLKTKILTESKDGTRGTILCAANTRRDLAKGLNMFKLLAANRGIEYLYDYHFVTLTENSVEIRIHIGPYYEKERTVNALYDDIM